MFAVAGTWIRDDAMRSRPSQALPDLVNRLRQNPGFIRGFWANDLDEPEGRVTFIADDTIDQARAFRDAVVANAAMQTRLGMGRSELHILRFTLTRRRCCPLPQMRPQGNRLKLCAGSTRGGVGHFRSTTGLFAERWVRARIKLGRMVGERATSSFDRSHATTDMLPDVGLSFTCGRQRNSQENATG